MSILWSSLVILLLAICCAAQQREAVAFLTTTTNSPTTISGSITFSQQGTGRVTVSASITGLPDGDYAIHVHQYGDLSDLAGASAGPHFVGAGSTTHGCPGVNATRHGGDMGSWTSTGGRISQEKTLDLLTLTGSNSIVGRAVVVHQLTDACYGDTGNAGKRYAFGVIGIRNIAGSAAEGVANNLLVCRLQGTTSCPNCFGTVWFEDLGDGLRVTANVSGLATNSIHGIHVHQFGDLSLSNNGSSLGGHWNPDGNLHGLPIVSNRHAGDLGNIQNYDQSGIAWYQYDTKIITSPASINGRGVVVHELLDHGRGFGCDNATGSSGVRYAICVIGIASNTTSVPEVPISLDNTWADVNCAEPPITSTSLTSTSISTETNSQTSFFSTSTFSSGSSGTSDAPSLSLSMCSFSAMLALLVLMA